MRDDGQHSSTEIYRLRNVRHRYGTHPTLDIDSLDLPRGGIIGLIGPNGSGKSTLLKILAFLERPGAGEIHFDGIPINGRERECRKDATLLLQEPYLLRRSVYENISYGLRLRKLRTEKEIDGIVVDSLERVGLNSKDFMYRPWYRLSGGEMQRVALASRLALRTKTLLLDEPTANVDESSASRIKEAVQNARTEFGTTIIVATHDMVWLYEVADRIVGLYRGRLIGDGVENILRGAWHRDGRLMTLSLRGQRIKGYFDSPGPTVECAVLNPSDVFLSAREPEKNPVTPQNTLYGTIIQMSLERSTGKILAVVDCDGTFLRVRLSLDESRSLNLYPGVSFYLTFPYRSLRFL